MHGSAEEQLRASDEGQWKSILLMWYGVQYASNSHISGRQRGLPVLYGPHPLWIGILLPGIVLPCCIPNARVSFVFNFSDSIHVSKTHPISSVRAYIRLEEYLICEDVHAWFCGQNCVDTMSISEKKIMCSWFIQKNDSSFSWYLLVGSLLPNRIGCVFRGGHNDLYLLTV